MVELTIEPSTPVGMGEEESIPEFELDKLLPLDAVERLASEAAIGRGLG